MSYTPFSPTAVSVSLPLPFSAALFCSLSSSQNHIPVGRSFSFQRTGEESPHLFGMGSRFDNLFSKISSHSFGQRSRFAPPVSEKFLSLVPTGRAGYSTFWENSFTYLHKGYRNAHPNRANCGKFPEFFSQPGLEVLKRRLCGQKKKSVRCHGNASRFAAFLGDFWAFFALYGVLKRRAREGYLFPDSSEMHVSGRKKSACFLASICLKTGAVESAIQFWIW